MEQVKNNAMCICKDLIGRHIPDLDCMDCDCEFFVQDSH